MTELARILVPLAVGLPAAGALLIAFSRSARLCDNVARGAGVLAAAAGLALAAVALAGDGPASGHWYVVDGAGGLLLGVTAGVGLVSVLFSPGHLRSAGRSWVSSAAAHRLYYVALLAFWSALAACALAANLAVAWLIVEATTAASALLVTFSGSRGALEAGWKYLVLTTLGLSVALLGIIVLAVSQAKLGHHGLHALDWRAIHSAAPLLPRHTALFAFVLIVVGLASKVGWAPVHNWLPDAHSEAPAPVSAMLSAALLPSVVLVAWRARTALGAGLGAEAGSTVFIGFGLISILVAVPFLWKRLPWKRLLAYSSLEHMGVIALGIGFGTPLAVAGVVLHIAGHALAKALGFYASLPLLRGDRRLGHVAPSGVAAGSPLTASAMAVSLISLAGLPPSPLFISELLILLGGVAAGDVAVVVVAALALALGFLGLVHVLIEGVLGEPGAPRHAAGAHAPTHGGGQRTLALSVGLAAAGLIALAVCGVALPGSALIGGLMRGVG